VGKPKCWLRFYNPRQCHGDVDGTQEGKVVKYWVLTKDQQVVNAAWGLNWPPGDKLTDANGKPRTTNVTGVPVALICADVDHNEEGKVNKYRVLTKDQGIVNTYWMGAAGPVPADCDP
jgi:hypothetical protein